MHRARVGIALSRFGAAGFVNDGIELEPALVIWFRKGLRWLLRKILMIQACADDIQHDPKAVEVGLRRAGTLRRDETFRADKGPRFTDAGDQTDIRQFGYAVDKNDVRRLY